MPNVIKSPRSLDIDITSRCNLRCKYCYHFSGPGDVDTDLPKEEWLRFFVECGHYGIMGLSLAGGEPFFRKDLPELLEGIIANRMRFSLLSNGTLIDDAWAKYIKETRRCNYIQVSLDGSRAEVHDQLRGKGQFDKAVAGLQHLQRHGVPVTVRVTLNKLNYHDLENIARFLLEELGLPAFSTNAASYMGLCKLNDQEIGLDVAERSALMAVFADLVKRYPGRFSANAGPQADLRMWSEMERARLGGLAPAHPTGALTACGCVFDRMAVRADGIMTPCTMLSHMEMGRINHDDLREVWQNHPLMQSMRARNEISLKLFDFCSSCNYINYCTGNCPGVAYELTGEVDHPSPDACFKRFLGAGGVLPEIN